MLPENITLCKICLYWKKCYSDVDQREYNNVKTHSRLSSRYEKGCKIMWILILIIVYSGSGISIDHIEFKTQKGCESAKETLLDENGIGYLEEYRVICVQK